MKKTVLIIIENKLIGFWCSVAILLKEKLNVVIVTNKTAEPIISNLLEKHGIEIYAHDDFYVQNPPLHDDLINQVRQREIKYGETFSMLLSHFRGIGKGYILNVDHVPDPENTKWSYEEKINAILHEFIFWERLVGESYPHIILSMMPSKIVSLISKSMGLTCLGLNYAKFGDRLFWIENEYYYNSNMVSFVKQYINQSDPPRGIGDVNYEFVASSKYTQSKLNHTYRSAIKKTILRILQECKHLAARTLYSTILKRQHRKSPYSFLAWLPVLLHHPYNYRYAEKKGTALGDLNGKKYVYLPLHFEPEMALMQLSPEFSNSLEMISWISKSLPVNHFIVVKEAPGCFGHRARRFYEKLFKIPNVLLAHPTIPAWDWIKNSVFVATITGTAGIESVYFKKPVLSYGQHQLINHLPTVKYVSDYQSTQRAITEILEWNTADAMFDIAREALYKTQMEFSFEIPGLIKHYLDRELKEDLAEIAVNNLFNQYSRILDIR